MKEKLSGVNYSLRTKINGVTARVHPNSIRHISKVAVQTPDPKEEVLPDGLMLLEKMTDAVERPCPRTGRPERLFKAQLQGRKSQRWTAETARSEAIVRLYDERRGFGGLEVRGICTQPTAETTSPVAIDAVQASQSSSPRGISTP